jgi:hypothetical protein
MKAVIDTNVLIAANGRDCPQVTPVCQMNTASYLRGIIENGTVILDNRWLILNEYKKKVNPSGQPGIGDVFLKWVLTNRGNPQRCEFVTIHPRDENNFAEFPIDPDLEKFDKSDRKFVAVALVHPEHPPVINAVDTDWRDFYEPLKKHGLTLQFLCPDVVSPP